MKKKLLHWSLAVLIASGSVANAADNPNVLTLDKFLVTAFDQVQVPGREQGVLVKFDPQTSLEGTEVKKGDVLGEMDTEDLLVKEESALLEIEVAKAQAESDAEIQAGIKMREVGEAEYASAVEANRRTPGSVSSNELRRLKLTVERAGFELELKRVEHGNYARTAKIKEAQVKAVRVELDRRRIVAPLDGVVVERLKHEGEWVQPGESVVKIVRLDKLRVEGFVPADRYSPHQVAGAKVHVTVELPDGGTATADGKIEYVSPIVETHGEYRVWTEIPNRRVDDQWVFRPGSVARIEIMLNPVTGSKFQPVSTLKGLKK